jgi:YVTN family beta-propeller protein
LFWCGLFLLCLVPACSSLQPPAPARLGTEGVISIIPVGEGPILLAVAPGGDSVYAVAKGKLLTIDTATNTVVASLSVGPQPSGVAVSPDAQRVYVNQLFGSQMAAVDAARHVELAPVPLGAGRIAGGWGRIAVSADGDVGYVTNRDKEALAIADLRSREALTVWTDIRPRDVALSPDGRYAYVCGCRGFCSGGSVRVYDRQARRFTGTLAAGPNPYRIVVGPHGRRAYTANLASPSISVIDLDSGTVVATVPVPNGPTGLFVSADGAWVYTSSNVTGEVLAIDTTNYEVRGRVRVGDRAREIVLTPDGGRAYVSTRRAVVVLDTAALTATDR